MNGSPRVFQSEQDGQIQPREVLLWALMLRKDPLGEPAVRLALALKKHLCQRVGQSARVSWQASATWVNRLSRAAAKHTTGRRKSVPPRIMADGSDLGVGVATGTVGSRSWEDYAPALAWSGPNLMRSLAESTW